MTSCESYMPTTHNKALQLSLMDSARVSAAAGRSPRQMRNRVRVLVGMWHVASALMSAASSAVACGASVVALVGVNQLLWVSTPYDGEAAPIVGSVLEIFTFFVGVGFAVSILLAPLLLVVFRLLRNSLAVFLLLGSAAAIGLLLVSFWVANHGSWSGVMRSQSSSEMLVASLFSIVIGAFSAWAAWFSLTHTYRRA